MELSIHDGLMHNHIHILFWLVLDERAQADGEMAAGSGS